MESVSEPVWRLIQDGAGASDWNMAVDEALLKLAAAPVLRLYQWSEPAMSLGYFQEAALVPEGRPFVRRYTGGGLVDHAHDVTYTVVAPRHHALAQLSTAESYSKIHEAVLVAARAIGLDAQLSADCEPEAAACFQRAVQFDVIHAGKKIAGAAQRRSRHGWLQQGSILLPDPALNAPLRVALPGAFTQTLGIYFESSTLSAEEEALADQLTKERYGTEVWNRQR